jgi:hypothetical protein
MSLVYWLFKTQIDKYKKEKVFVLATVLLLLSSLVPFYSFYPSVQVNGDIVVVDQIIGLILGSDQSNYFPILQYSFFFFVGILFSERNIVFSSRVLSGCIVGTTAFLVYFLVIGEPPSRFPPHLLWLTGSWLLLYGTYLACKTTSQLHTTFLVSIGENTLVYLLISNIIFFELAESTAKSVFLAIGSSFSVILVTMFIITCTRKTSLGSVEIQA